MEYRDTAGKRWQVRLAGQPAVVASLEMDGERVEVGEICIDRDVRSARLWLEQGGIRQLAHAALVGDKWWIHIQGEVHVLTRLEPGAATEEPDSGALIAPMPGKVLEVYVAPGQQVCVGDALLVLEAMKMEHRIQSAVNGEVIAVHHVEGDQVDAGAVLVEIAETTESE
jgi:acetyl/propionyl-CoA carboxylase alpha subunit